MDIFCARATAPVNTNLKKGIYIYVYIYIYIYHTWKKIQKRRQPKITIAVYAVAKPNTEGSQVVGP